MKIEILGLNENPIEGTYFDVFWSNYTILGEPTSTEIVLRQPDNGALTIITGNDFYFDESLFGTYGDITSVDIVLDGVTLSRFSGIYWDIGYFLRDLEEAKNGDQSKMWEMFNRGPLTVDASLANVGVDSAYLGFEEGFSPTHGLEFFGSVYGDIVTGTSGFDTLYGGDGGDEISGGLGPDEIYGGKGNDILYGNQEFPPDPLAADYLSKIYGGRGKDSIYGTEGEDNLSGGAGNDIIFGDGSRDDINGGQGDDKIWGGTGDDGLNAGSGNDRVFGGQGFDQIRGHLGKDELFGGTGRDILWGGIGRDKLFGGAGQDYLEGGGGRDLLVGGKGKDHLVGGKGIDVFLFAGTSMEGKDEIYNFEDGLDVIRIKGATATDVVSILSSGSDGNDTIIILASGTEITLKYIDFSDISLDDFQFV